MTEHRFEDVLMIADNAGYKLHTDTFDGKVGYMLVEQESGHQIDFIFSTLNEVLKFLARKLNTDSNP